MISEDGVAPKRAALFDPITSNGGSSRGRRADQEKEREGSGKRMKRRILVGIDLSAPLINFSLAPSSDW